MKRIEDDISLRNAITAYADALDTVEECLRNKTEPFVSNKHLSQIRLFKNPIRISSDFSMRTFWIFLISGLALASGFSAGWVNFFDTPLHFFLTMGVVAIVILKMWMFTFSALILQIGGGRKIQKKESAKILNELLRKSL